MYSSSCTQARCSLQYRHVQSMYGSFLVQRKGWGGRRPTPSLYILSMVHKWPAHACTVGCTWLVCSLCAAYVSPYVASICRPIYRSRHKNCWDIYMSGRDLEAFGGWGCSQWKQCHALSEINDFVHMNPLILYQFPMAMCISRLHYISIIRAGDKNWSTPLQARDKLRSRDKSWSSPLRTGT